MKKRITLILTVLIVLGMCACSSKEIQKTNPADMVDAFGELSQPSDAIMLEEHSTFNTSDKSISRPNDENNGAVSDETLNTPSAETDVKQEPSTSPAIPKTPQTTPKEPESQTEQKTPAPSKETAPKTEPSVETGRPQEPTQSSASKTAYDYEFDIDQIRNDLIALAKGYGLTLDESINPNNASWANPVAATKNTQGDLLKRLLNESIQYYADSEYREAMGLPDLGLTIFNIYCESLGNGEYRFYFLNY